MSRRETYERQRERQREREVQRYHQPWLAAQGSSLNVLSHLDSIAAADLNGEGYTPKQSQDKALTAFAQLAVLRLNVKRAMVSLIDTSTQTILAEATRNTFLGEAHLKNTRGGASSDLWSNDEARLPVGTTVLSRPNAVCEHCLTNTYTAHDEDGSTHTAPALVVPDCRLDPRFQARSYVQSEPGVRFYAGVPIISPSGHKIGAYAVSDGEPRHGLTVDELQFMQGVAQAVMQHLEWARDRVDRFKGARIVRGLASFIEGNSTLNDPSADDEPPTANGTPLPATAPPSSRSVTPTMKRSPSQTSTHSRLSHCGSPRLSEASRSSSPSTLTAQRRSDMPKPDSLARLFDRAATILRQSALADGVVFFGATAANTRQFRPPHDDSQAAVDTSSGHEGFGLDSSDSDASPSGRPCKLLGYSLADEQARADIEQDKPLTIGTLERYHALFPRGKSFSFTEEGSGISSEDESASDRDTQLNANNNPTNGTNEPHGAGGRRRSRMDHKELLKKIPGAKAVAFLPLYDYGEDRLAGGCFIWTSVTGRLMTLDEDLSYLKAFGNSIMSEVGRINTQKNEAAKTTFIASMSHELRSPLHGILGAAEFLVDTATSSYQSGLISSISTCGKTLLDTLNHVLDYSKINKLGRPHMRRNARRPQNLLNLASDPSLESLNLTAVVDLSILVEEVVDAVTAGHTFKMIPGTVFSKQSKSNTSASLNSMSAGAFRRVPEVQHPVSVLLDINPEASWMVKTQPGAIRRIVMNLLGNSLKYTSAGYVLVSVRAQGSADGSKIEAVIRVVDSGKGMSEDFQRDRLFVPFSQEDSFQPGTGLGLSIVKQIVDSLGGKIEFKSQQHKGTEVDVRLSLPRVIDSAVHQPDEEMYAIKNQTKGLKLVILDAYEPSQPKPIRHQVRGLNETIRDTCTNWFRMKVAVEEPEDASQPDLYLYCEPPSLEMLQKRFRGRDRSSPRKRKIPIVIVSLNAKEAIQISQNQSRALMDLGEIVEVIPQPCGPRKLAKVFNHCLKRAEEATNGDLDDAGTLKSDETLQQTLGDKSTGTSGVAWETRLDNIANEQAKPALQNGTAEGNAAQAPPTPPEPETLVIRTDTMQKCLSQPKKDVSSSKLHVLLVDDNKINLQLLVMFVKKQGFTYEEAENGQEALDKYKAAGSGRRFDLVLMDISMPIMDGLEATRRIRDFESENELQRANIVALTGLASSDTQRDAKTAGVDVFLAKPVRFASLKKLLDVE
ncbi:hypothetical protein JX266_009873 [Neoarthrinium moseri]|nr:hypothetical protein JX266_009873 [Neoarthrinium moseri]